ncbi:Integral membrane protein DGCR2/IDD [Collichthys lucidus]|uniref:Integral membrane protein DGCR2/IDD n=1 Tax=Collichthys lucidus TaxID=240159 RepID=A0A4U5V9Q3_COLLU|nr:Integral membrane protein DGCR2/IDD [Collichthys lucidus]
MNTGRKTIKEERFRFGNGYDQVEDVIGVAQPVRFNKKCPSGWHHYEKTASCYKVYPRNENYWQAVDTCQKVNGSLATFVTNEELQFILKIEVDFDDKFCERRDQCKFWVGYQYVFTNQNHSLEGHWEVAYKGQHPMRPAAALSDQKHERARPAQLARRELLQEVPLSLQEEYALIQSSPSDTLLFLDYVLMFYFSPTGQTCVDIKDNVVNEGYYFTPKGDDPCLSCTCHDGEPEMCVAALCERPQGCQHFRKDPKECCKFTCLDPVHHFNLGRRVPGFDYGPDAFGTGLTPLHLSDDGEGGAFHFQEPPPPYAAYKYPDIQHPDDPPPPYEASINPDSLLYVDLGHRGVSMVPSQMNAMGDGLQADIANQSVPVPASVPSTQEREDSIDSSTLLHRRIGPWRDGRELHPDITCWFEEGRECAVHRGGRTQQT